MCTRKRTIPGLAFKLWVALGCVPSAASSHAAEVAGASAAQRIVIIDTHAHIIRSRAADGRTTASLAIRVKDELNVATTILLPPPFTPGHPGTYGKEEIGPVIRDHPQRFFLAAGGESLNPMIHAVAPKDVTPAHIARFQQEAARIVESGAVGFGELTAEHLSSGRRNHPYESAPPDHPLFLALADIAARHAMPIDLHMEAVPKDMETPERMRRGDNPSRLRENISGLERLLAHNRSARIVWAHAGWDNTGERTPILMRSLLERHPNLYMSIKLDPQAPRRTTPFIGENTLRPPWVALLRAFRDRFMIGSDQFFEEGGARISLSRVLVDALPPDVAPLVASENARRVYRLDAKPK